EPRPRGRLVSIAGTALAALTAFGVLHLAVMRAGKDAQTVGAPDHFIVASTQSEAAPLRTGGVALRQSLAMPLVTMGPIVTIGTPTPGFDAAGLQQKLQNALSRFDEVRVHIDLAATAGAPATARRELVAYRLAGTLEAGDAEAPQLTFRLLDAGDNSVVWSK